MKILYILINLYRKKEIKKKKGGGNIYKYIPMNNSIEYYIYIYSLPPYKYVCNIKSLKGKHFPWCKKNFSVRFYFHL